MIRGSSIAQSSESLARWENEGGARQNPVKARVEERWSATQPLIQGSSIEADLGGDRGLSDQNTLAILRISLMLLVPALALIVIFWANIVSAH